MRTLLALLALLAAPAAFAEEQTIRLGVGAQKILSVAGMQRVAVGDPGVADVKPVEGGQLLIVGTAKGTTTLLVWNAAGKPISYTLRVGDSGEEVSEELRKLLGDREGITLRIVGERTYLEGVAYSAEDYDRAQAVAKLYEGKVVNLVRMAPQARRNVAERINLALQRERLPGAKAVVVGDRIFLEGTVESPEDRERAEKVANAVLGDEAK